MVLLAGGDRGLRGGGGNRAHPAGDGPVIIIRLVGVSTGEPTEFDGQYVRNYDPTRHRSDGSYDGGILEVTSNPQEAAQFSDMAAAVTKYRQAYGKRADGLPNRPLTAWTAEFLTPEAAKEMSV